MSKHLAVLVAAGTLLIGCTAGDDTASEDTAGGSATTVDSIAVPTGPAPGVTDDTVKVGVTYVDLASLGEVVNIDHGDYEVAYQAMFDDINASGGINGRMIEPVFAPVSPVGTEGAEQPVCSSPRTTRSSSSPASFSTTRCSVRWRPIRPR